MACIAKRRGRYVIDFYDTYGKRRWITMPRGATKKKATEKLREVEDQLRRGIYLPDEKIPNFKQVAKDWIDYKKPNLRHSTWSVYEGHTRNHFDDFNPVKINRITTAKVEKWITARHNEGMNISTLKKILVTPGANYGLCGTAWIYRLQSSQRRGKAEGERRNKGRQNQGFDTLSQVRQNYGQKV